ncbi:hypothetical protein HYY70_02370 [Candidatus Woesearchaeota archaeon]|nr:hypothetical protein [Candidatus Woesearchaeota archaeon]
MGKNYHNGEPHLLSHYVSPDSAIHQIIANTRQGFLAGEKRRFGEGLVSKAKSEFQTKARDLDASTYPFTQDLSRHLYGSDARVVMLVEGMFHGSEPVKSIIPIDFGFNPYLLFKNSGSTTIDERVTVEQTTEFLDRVGTATNGFSSFAIAASRFFYFKAGELEQKGFMKDGELDMTKLVPFISPTPGYIVLTPVRTPSIGEYMEYAPVHTSYRQKASLASKLLKLASLPYGSIQENGEGTEQPISDWVAHRPVVGTLDEVFEFESFLRSAPRIGNFDVEHIHTTNFYEKPKPSGFKALKVVVLAHPTGANAGRFEPSVRGIQIVDKSTYFENEFVEGRTSHLDYDKRRSTVRKYVRGLRSHYAKILEQIFGRDIKPIIITQL